MHPIPTRYLEMHNHSGTWKDPFWQPILKNTMTDKAYD